ncbi:MAG: DUF1028 domain-containing protein [Acidobacteria bacterium]|nr:DUF1028 domain-containing protein [Acidobacteriota bacterium]MDW7984549.1 DUF1028 domain-containing protein [Acidobacteriota bacterium]
MHHTRGRKLLLTLGGLLLSALARSAPAGGWAEPVATYSIVAIDKAANEMGVAVQSCYFVVGPTVIWVEPGVGAVATQAYVDVSYGPLSLALLRGGKTAPQALEALLGADNDRELRQVAVVDTEGRIAVHTGKRATPAAGHRTGPEYSAQGNLLANDRVWQAMGDAFERTKGPLAERFLAALEAAEAEGGDLRCRQSAAMKIVRVRPEGPDWRNVVLDLRVDDHPQPVSELRRLYRIWQGIQLFWFEAGRRMAQGDIEGAQRAFEQALALAPEKTEWRFWHAVRLIEHGRVESGIQLLKDLVAREPQYRTLWERMLGTGVFQIDPHVWAQVRQAIAGR